jgi:hypothetical protein
MFNLSLDFAFDLALLTFLLLFRIASFQPTLKTTKPSFDDNDKESLAVFVSVITTSCGGTTF